MRIAVTGGSGRIGSYVCGELAAGGHDIVVVDRAPPRGAAFEYREADLCDAGAAARALADAELVVHLAAIPNPYGVPAEQVMACNTSSALNVFEACRAAGVERVVYACSESATGFGIHHVPLVPDFLPVSEAHPCWPHETYSFSKYFGELIGENYARAYGLQVLSLRYTWVWFPEEIESYRGILAAKQTVECPASPWFGAYIGVTDVARAVRKSVDYRREGAFFEAFLLTARDTFYGVPTPEVLRAVYGKLPPVTDEAYFRANPFASVFDIRKAERVLGWTPRCDIDTLEQWDW